MPKIKNINPLGAVDVPLLGRVLDAGEEVEVTTEQAERLLTQEHNYEPIDKAAKAIHKKVTAPPPAPEQVPSQTQDEAGSPAEEVTGNDNAA